MDETVRLDVSDDIARGALEGVPLLADDDAELLLLPLPQPQHLEGLGGARGGGQLVTGRCYNKMTAMLTKYDYPDNREKNVSFC